MRNLFRKTLRIVVLVSGRGSNLEAIHKAICEKKIDAKIALVISDREDAKALEFCLDESIPAQYIHPGVFKTKLEGEAEQNYIRLIDSMYPDLIVLAGFMRVLKPAFLKAFEGKIINIHPSLLPKYPGLHTHERALEAGDKESGCTVHFVSEVVDGGKRIIQAKVPIRKGDTADDIRKRTLTLEYQILPAAIQMFVDGKIEYEGWKDEPIEWK